MTLHWKLALFFLVLAPIALAAQTPDFDDAFASAAATSHEFASVVIANQPDRIVLVLLGMHSATDQENGCSWNGTTPANGETMTKVGFVEQGGATMSYALFKLLDPTATTASIRCGTDSSIAVSIGVVSAYGADNIRTAQFLDYSGSSQDPAATSTLESATGDIAIWGVIVRSGTCENTQSGYTIMWDDNNINDSGRVHCAIRKSSDGDPVTMSLDLDASRVVAAIGASITPVATGTAGAAEVIRRRR